MDSRISSATATCSVPGCTEVVTAHRLGICEEHSKERRRAQRRDATRRFRSRHSAEENHFKNRDHDHRRRLLDREFAPILIEWRNPDRSLDYWLVSSRNGEPVQTSLSVFLDLYNRAMEFVPLNAAERTAFDSTMDWIELLLRYRDRGHKVKFKERPPRNINVYGIDPMLHQWFQAALQFWTKGHDEHYAVREAAMDDGMHKLLKGEDWELDPRSDLGDFVHDRLPIKRGFRAAGTKIAGQFACQLLAAWGPLVFDEAYHVEVERLVKKVGLDTILKRQFVWIDEDSVFEIFEERLRIGIASTHENGWRGVLERLREYPEFQEFEKTSGYCVEDQIERALPTVRSRLATRKYESVLVVGPVSKDDDE